MTRSFCFPAYAGYKISLKASGLSAMGTSMAYILRSLAVVGVIALNSPVHGSRSGEDHASQPTAIRNVVKAASQFDGRSAINGLTAAREAAQILAGLEPETRERVLALAAAAAAGKAQTHER
jgi:hypothetical protein